MKTHSLGNLALLAVFFGAILPSAILAAPPTEDELLAVLASGASAGAKCAACCDLRIAGTEKSVPRLAAMLTDPALSHGARIALEVMPYPSAGAALRDALAKTSGAVKAGIFDSLGNRRDQEAVPMAIATLEDKDLQVLSAAASALGKIGTREATRPLLYDFQPLHPKPKILGAAQNAKANALLVTADRLVAEGDRRYAMLVYENLAQPGQPAPIRATALRGYLRVADLRDALMHDAPDRDKPLVDWLASPDPLFRAAGAARLGSVRQSDDLKSIVFQWDRLPGASQAAVLMAIRLKGDKAFLDIATQSAAASDPVVRVAAIRALGVLGSSATVPILIRAMDDNATAQAARESLEALRDPDVDGRIVTAMQQEKDAARRGMLIAVLQTRRSVASVPALLEEARRGPAREQAVTTLAQLARHENVPAMIELALNTPKGTEREQVERAVMLVCRKIPDEKKRSAPVLDAFQHASPANQLALFPMLGRMGGDDARKVVEAALTGADAPRSDAAVTALCNWPDASVTDRLWQLAQQERDPARRERLLRAAVRLTTQPGGAPDAQKIARLTEALQLARTTEDRVWILERAAAVRHVESLRLVLPYLNDPALAPTACKTVVELAHHRGLREPNQKEFTPALEKVLTVTRDATLVERARRYLGK